MKKIIYILLAAIMAVGLFTGCEAEGKNPFSLDSKEPQWDKFQDYLKGNKEFLSRCARTIISMSLQR